MLRPRIIPCLLIHQGGLVKTVRFRQPKYIGDPLNAVRIFNEKGVDELMVIDIDASRTGRAPNEDVVAALAAECRMPLCYGGGVKTVDQLERLISLGVEKVSIGSAAVETPELVSQAAARVGSQSVVAVMDVKASGMWRRPEVVLRNGTRRTGLTPVEFVKRVEALGAGEIVLNCVDRDGRMNGYDLPLIDEVKAATTRPLTVLGGAGTFADIEALVRRYPIIGAAAGSIFVFQGPFRAVLISYPDWHARDALVS